MKLVEITDVSFEKEVLQSDLPVCVKMTASWCKPCESFEPLLEEVADEVSGKCILVKLDIDDNQKTTKEYGVKSIPALLVFKNGELTNRMIGRDTKENVLKLLDP